MKTSWYLLAAILLGGTATAEEQREALEPVAFEEIRPTATGSLETQLLLDRSRRNKELDNYDTQLSYLGIFYGVAERTSVEVQVPYLTQRGLVDAQPVDLSGLADLRTGVKYALQDSPSWPVIVGMGLTLPTASKARGLTEGKVRYELSLGTTETLGDLTLWGKLGYGTSNLQPERELNYNAGMGYEVMESLYFHLEGMYTKNELLHKVYSYAGPGVQWRFTPSATLGISLPVGLSQASDNQRFMLKARMEM